MSLPSHTDHSSPQASHQAYREAGVDLDRANAVVDIAKKAAQSTRQPFLMNAIGGFSGAFKIPAGYSEPVLLAACDGVGTKLELAKHLQDHSTVGIDLVAMNVNDILTQGGKPLVFLDYLSTGAIEEGVFSQVLDGIAEGCRQAGCALAGGETAEMPGFYPAQTYDLAGFCVGVAEAAQMLPHPNQMEPGDVIIGLTSSGFHSNGYSLVRKVFFQDHPTPMDTPVPGTDRTLGEALLIPTRIYVEPVLQVLERHPGAITGMVHNTGGGFIDNLPRILPTHLNASVDVAQCPMPPEMSWLQGLAGLDWQTMAHTFNCGIGFMVVVKASMAQDVLATFQAQCPDSWSPRIMGSLMPVQGTEAGGRVVFS